MTVHRRKGPAGKADMLFSRLVRSRATCERCGGQATDTAHIVRRCYSATRCDEQNAWALCSSCHRATERDPAEFMELVARTIGRDVYNRLREKAEAGIGPSRLFWRAEVERLTARCKEEGIDTRWRVT